MSRSPDKVRSRARPADRVPGWVGWLLAGAALVSACATTEESTPTTVLPTTVLPTTVLPTTVLPTTVLPTNVLPTTVLPTTSPADGTSGPTDSAALAGARVLCTFEGTDVPADVIDRVRTGRAAGVLLFAENLGDRAHAEAEAHRLQTAAGASPSGAPALIAVDQEGGTVARIPGPPTASAGVMGTWPADRIRSEAAATAANLAQWGINTDLAPVADVARPGGFIDHQDRSFSPDPAVAATAVGAFVRGLHDGDVAATVKHVPGLGAATIDTDDAISSVALTLDEIRATDLVPVRAGVDAGADLVMMSSAVYSALAEEPAVLSGEWIDTVVRDELGFDGVIVSDALDTPSLARYGSVGEIAVRAARAGVDLFIAGDPSACATIQVALERAIEAGVVSAGAALSSYRRMITLRDGLRA